MYIFLCSFLCVWANDIVIKTLIIKSKSSDGKITVRKYSENIDNDKKVNLQILKKDEVTFNITRNNTLGRFIDIGVLK